jgi:hypothetical protein
MAALASDGSNGAVLIGTCVTSFNFLAMMPCGPVSRLILGGASHTQCFYQHQGGHRAGLFPLRLLY